MSSLLKSKIIGCADRHGIDYSSDNVNNDLFLISAHFKGSSLTKQLVLFHKGETCILLENIHRVIFSIPAKVLLEYGFFESLRDMEDYIILKYYFNDIKCLDLLGSIGNILLLIYELRLAPDKLLDLKNIIYMSGFPSDISIAHKRTVYLLGIIDNAYKYCLCNQNRLTFDNVMLILHMRKKAELRSFDIKFVIFKEIFNYNKLFVDSNENLTPRRYNELEELLYGRIKSF